MRIHGQMYLGVESPFVRSIAWFPHRAPAASGCILTWLALSISPSESASSTRASRIFSQIPLSRHRQNPSVYILPVSIRSWQILPWRPSTQNPEYTVDKLPGITDIPSTCSFFANGVRPDSLPRAATYIMPMQFSCHFPALPSR